MASKYIQKFPIPGQFPDILHDFVREVLRDQPENIYEYGAAYFAALDDVSPLGSFDVDNGKVFLHEQLFESALYF